MQHLQETPTSCEPVIFKYCKWSFGEMFQVLQSLRQHEVFCDIKLETDDGTIIFGHKVVLASASPYFHAMFTNFAEKNKDLVVIRQLDSAALQLLVDFIYSGIIIVTETNVQVLLSAANFLQLNDVKKTCSEFLEKQLCPTNCFGIKAFADSHSCTQLLKSSEMYIQNNFLEVVESDEFLSLSSEQVVKLISSDEVKVPSEEKVSKLKLIIVESRLLGTRIIDTVTLLKQNVSGRVFECVIRWVKHKLDSRKCILTQLMEHVRLPLTSKNYIFQKVLKEPILNNCHKCKEYIYEALHFLERNQSDQVITIAECIRYKPRRTHKVIFVVGGSGHRSTEWYSSKGNRWCFGLRMITDRSDAGVAVLDNFVFALGGYSQESTLQSVDVLDLSPTDIWRPSGWKSSIDMLVIRRNLGVGVINNYMYAVGGHDGTNSLNSAEVFEVSTKQWRMVSSMSTERDNLGVGVLNNLLYAVGGYDSSSGEVLNTVECYSPSLDTWTPVAEMCKRRYGMGVGVLYGTLYAVGGGDGSETFKSVEAFRPSTRVWTTMADMLLPRKNLSVIALEGFLYAVGGCDRSSIFNSVEVYNPITNTWTMLGASMHMARANAGIVAVNRQPTLKIC